MSKVILNTSKRIELESNSGRLIFKAKMKVDYDAVNDIFGSREWFFCIMDLSKKVNINPQINGVNVFSKKSYLHKKNMLNDLKKLECFRESINQMKNGVKP